MQKISSFLWFDKNCEEAVNFYVALFNGSPAKLAESKVVSLKRYPNGPLEEPMKGMEGKILTVVFELEGQTFMALDGGPFFKPSGAISFYITCATQVEVDYFWSRLTEGGAPEAQQCGWLADRYGFSWQIVPETLPRLLSDPDRVKADRVLQAMLKMKKIDIAELEKAAAG